MRRLDPGYLVAFTIAATIAAVLGVLGASSSCSTKDCSSFSIILALMALFFLAPIAAFLSAVTRASESLSPWQRASGFALSATAPVGIIGMATAGDLSGLGLFLFPFTFAWSVVASYMTGSFGTWLSDLGRRRTRR